MLITCAEKLDVFGSFDGTAMPCFVQENDIRERCKNEIRRRQGVIDAREKGPGSERNE